MRVRKFRAKTLKDALSQVKLALGPNATVAASQTIYDDLLGQQIEVSACVPQQNERRKNGTGQVGHVNPIDPMRWSDSLGPIRHELRLLRQEISSLLQQRQADAQLLAELKQHLLSNQMASISPAAYEYAAALEFPSDHTVAALVGPPGVGKTTTLAKIAARAALIHDQQVALICCDQQRMHAFESLSETAAAIGIPCEPAFDAKSLRKRLGQFEDKKLVLIDTSGYAAREQTALQQMSDLLHTTGIATHLILGADSNGEAMANSVDAYRILNPRSLSFTKLDISTGGRQVQLATQSSGLPVMYLTNGRRIPEDIAAATSERMNSLMQTKLFTMEQSCN